MKIKSFLDEAIIKGEQLKTDVLNELFKSKALQDLVANKNFVSAVTRIIETKDEAKRVISKQVKSLFEVMDVPTKDELKKVAAKIVDLEKILDNLGRKKIAVKILNKSVPSATKRTVSKKRAMTGAAPKPKRRSAKGL